MWAVLCSTMQSNIMSGCICEQFFIFLVSFFSVIWFHVEIMRFDFKFIELYVWTNQYFIWMVETVKRAMQTQIFSLWIIRHPFIYPFSIAWRFYWNITFLILVGFHCYTQPMIVEILFPPTKTAWWKSKMGRSSLIKMYQWNYQLE